MQICSSIPTERKDKDTHIHVCTFICELKIYVACICTSTLSPQLVCFGIEVHSLFINAD